jgi:hypothetical protein
MAQALSYVVTHAHHGQNELFVTRFAGLRLDVCEVLTSLVGDSRLTSRCRIHIVQATASLHSFDNEGTSFFPNHSFRTQLIASNIIPVSTQAARGSLCECMQRYSVP